MGDAIPPPVVIDPPEGFPQDATADTRPLSDLQQTEWAGRESWLPGPWHNEPWDVIRWIDPTTGLHCLLSRSRAGSWCGYVGVGPDHPWFGVGYSGCINKHAPLSLEERKREAREALGKAWAAVESDPTNELFKSNYRLAELFYQGISGTTIMSRIDKFSCLTGDNACGTPEGALNVHGGITFSGDRNFLMPTEDAGLWWFGFDCHHHMDIAPGMLTSSLRMREKMEAKGDYSGLFREHLEYDPVTGTSNRDGSAYRDVGYAKTEIEDLARQLKDINNDNQH